MVLFVWYSYWSILTSVLSVRFNFINERESLKILWKSGCIVWRFCSGRYRLKAEFKCQINRHIFFYLNHRHCLPDSQFRSQLRLQPSANETRIYTALIVFPENIFMAVCLHSNLHTLEFKSTLVPAGLDQSLTWN